MGCVCCRPEPQERRSLLHHKGTILLEYDSGCGLPWLNQQLDAAVVSSTSDSFDLSLSFRRRRDDVGLTLATLASQLPTWTSLRHLGLTFAKVKPAVSSDYFDTFFHILSGCSRLQSLTIYVVPATGKVLEKLTASRAFSRFIGDHKHLQGLHILEKEQQFGEWTPELRLRTSFAHVVGRHRTLAALTLHNVKAATGSRDNFLGHFLPYLSHRKQLTHLDLSGARGLPLHDLAVHVQGNTSLVALSLRAVRFMGDEPNAMDASTFFQAFAYHPNLRSLDLRSGGSRTFFRPPDKARGAKLKLEEGVRPLLEVLPTTLLGDVALPEAAAQFQAAVQAVCEENRRKPEATPHTLPKYATPLVTCKAEFLAPHHPGELKETPGLNFSSMAGEDGEGMECSVCMAAHVAVRFHPCYHAVCCTACARLLTKCPLCAGPITEREEGVFADEYAPESHTPMQGCRPTPPSPTADYYTHATLESVPDIPLSPERPGRHPSTADGEGSPRGLAVAEADSRGATCLSALPYRATGSPLCCGGRVPTDCCCTEGEDGLLKSVTRIDGDDWQMDGESEYRGTSSEAADMATSSVLYTTPFIDPETSTGGDSILRSPA
eukprot:EG_transcript_2349